MKNKDKNESFIPRKAPKSFVIAIIAGMVGVLFTGPLMLVAFYVGLKAIFLLGQLIFALCCALGVACGFFFISGLMTGRYRNIQERNWAEIGDVGSK
jgi:hypothetical protein